MNKWNPDKLVKKYDMHGYNKAQNGRYVGCSRLILFDDGAYINYNIFGSVDMVDQINVHYVNSKNDSIKHIKDFIGKVTETYEDIYGEHIPKDIIDFIENTPSYKCTKSYTYEIDNKCCKILSIDYSGSSYISFILERNNN